MQLTTQNFAEVIDSLRSAPRGAGGEEKRRATRMEVQAPVVVAPLIDGAPGAAMTCLTRDISLSGAGLLTSVRVAPQAPMVVRLPRGGAKPALFVRSVARHCRALADGIYVVGAEFEEVMQAREEALVGGTGEDQLSRIRSSILG